MVESICSPTNTEDYLLASLSAVGLASYAASVRSPKLMMRARRDYGHALSMTNQALKSPAKYTNDSTLFAVMALGVFEAVAGSGAESLDAWNNHLMGASALVKERGPMQLMTEAGQRMFQQINSNLMFYNITYGLEIPAHIIELRKFSEPFIDTMDCGWRISEQIIHFSNLRARVLQGKLRDRRDIVNKVLEIDDVYTDISEKRSHRWRGKIIRDNTNPDAIWNGFYVVYSEFWVAQMLNTMRIFRIHTLEILREQVRADIHHEVFSAEEAASLLQRAVATMSQMQAQILASVPQYAPWGVTSYPSSSRIEPWHAYQVLWPLYLTANLDFTTREVTEWALKRFQVMDKEGGIEHAKTFAAALEKRLQLRSDGTGEKGLANVLKMDPFDWKTEGWAIVHATILSAQINKPKTPPASPKTGNMAPPSIGTSSGPPAGWTGQKPPSWWRPGMPMGPPAHVAQGASSSSRDPVVAPHGSENSTASSSVGGGNDSAPTMRPPPWWKPGMPMGPPAHLNNDKPSTSTDHVEVAHRHGASTMPPESSTSGSTRQAMQQPPPWWRPGMPMGPPGRSSQNMATPAASSHEVTSANSRGAQNASPDQRSYITGDQNTMHGPKPHPQFSMSGPPKFAANGIPIGWSGPPPEGWMGTGSPSQKIQSSMTSAMTSTGPSQNSGITPPVQPSPQFQMSGPPKFGENGIPIGWKGPPPKGWKMPGS